MNRTFSARAAAFAVGLCLLLVTSALSGQQLRSSPPAGNAGLRPALVAVSGSFATDFGNGVSGGTLTISASTGDAVWVFVTENTPANNVASVVDSNSNTLSLVTWLSGGGGTTTPSIYLYEIDSETATTTGVTVTNTGNTATSAAAVVLSGASSSASVAAYGSGQYNASTVSITSTGDSATSPSSSDPYFLFYGVSANSGTTSWSPSGGAATVVSTTGSGSNQAVAVFEENFSSSGSNTVLASGGTGHSNSNWYGLAVVAATAGGGGHVPSAPTGLHATANSTTTISLAWTLPNGTVSNVTVYYAQSGCPMTGTVHALSAGNVSAYVVRGLAWGTGYAFEVQAWNSSGGSNRSGCAATATSAIRSYGYLEHTYALPGFDPLTGYLSNLGGADTQIPTLSSDTRQPAGIYYVDNSSRFDIVYLGNGTAHSIAHIVPLYQTYASYNEMLDNEFFVEFGYDQALFFGTSTSSGSSYSIELVNLTSALTRVWNTSAAVDGTNQQPDYVGNNTVVVMSSNCSILAWNLASHQEWSAGTLGASFGGGSTCFEANNVYWFPQKQQIINVEAHGDSGDHVEQLNASFDAQGRIHFTSVATISVDSGVVYNWVNGIAFNSSVDEIAFSAGYWVANTVYTYVVPYANGRITATGEVRYSADDSGTPTGELLAIQRYVYVDDYMLGQHQGPGTWTNGTQFLFDPWNGSLERANRSIDYAPCGNECFEGQYAPSPAFQLDYNATLRLNSPMWRVVYAYHSAVSPNPSPNLTLTPGLGPAGTTVTLSGSGFGSTATYQYCFQATASACPSGSSFASTSGGAIPSGVTAVVPSSGNSYVDISNGTALVVDVLFAATIATLNLTPSTGPSGTSVSLSGSGFAPATSYDVCWAPSSAAVGCPTAQSFTSTGNGTIPAAVSATWSSGDAWVAVSEGTSAAGFIVSAPFSPQSGGGGSRATLSPPTGLTASPGTSCASETLAWTNPPNVQGLVVISDSVYLSTASGQLLEELDLGSPAQSQTVTGLVCSLTYQAQVRAWYTGNTASPISDNVTFLTAPVPGNVTGTTAQPTVARGTLDLLLLGFLALIALVILTVALLVTRHARPPSGRRR